MGMRILIADSDSSRRQNVEALIQRMGLRTLVADGGDAVLAFLRDRKDIALLLLDLSLEGASGLALLLKIRQLGYRLPIIALETGKDFEKVSLAVQYGATDFVTTPIPPERLRISVTNALKMEALTEDIRKGGSTLYPQFSLADLTTKSPIMAATLAQSRRLASTSEPLLLQGERGSGKELLARAIAGSATGSIASFTVIDCRRFDSNRDNALLISHRIGRDLGDSSAQHLVDLPVALSASQTTIYLDEVWALPFAVQERIYNLLKAQLAQQTGHSADQPAEVRIIGATTTSLEVLSAEGRFHSGLCELLLRNRISVPALKERREDIPHLLQHFVMRFAMEERRTHIRGIQPYTLKRLTNHSWPDNIRELKNSVYRAVVTSESAELECRDFAHLHLGNDEKLMPVPLGRHGHTIEASASSVATELVALNARVGTLSGIDDRGEVRTLASAEADMIRLALVWYSGQISEVARRLGIGRTTLYRKMKEYGIDMTNLGVEDADDVIYDNVKVAI